MNSQQETNHFLFVREKLMSKVKSEMGDDLQLEYDLYSMRVRKLGPGRKCFGGLNVYLDLDVAEILAKLQ